MKEEEGKRWGFSVCPTMGSKLDSPPFPRTWDKNRYNAFTRFCRRNYHMYSRLDGNQTACELIRAFEKSTGMQESHTPMAMTDVFEASLSEYLRLIRPLGGTIVSSTVKVTDVKACCVKISLTIRGAKDINLGKKELSIYKHEQRVVGSDVVVVFVLDSKVTIKSAVFMERLRRDINKMVSKKLRYFK